MIDFKFGKGKGKRFERCFMPLNANLSEILKNKTLAQIAKQLAIQSDIKDGEVTLIGLEFVWARAK